MHDMSGPQRPWWADAEVVHFWIEQRAFETTHAYLEGLANAIEHRIAYAAEDPAATAAALLGDLDEALRDDRVLGGSLGARVEQILDQQGGNG